jgi:hypothetical protein
MSGCRENGGNSSGVSVLDAKIGSLLKLSPRNGGQKLEKNEKWIVFF